MRASWPWPRWHGPCRPPHDPRVAQLAEFNQRQHALHADAMRLRRFDEQAKVKGLRTPPAPHVLPHLESCLTQFVATP